MESNRITGDSNSEEQQSQTESSVRPTLSQVKKSWGFRRSTIARREFMEEVGDLTHSPPLVRRGRSRRANQTPETPTDTCTTQRANQPTRSVIDDLEWSAPSSPISEETTLEASTAGSLDPSLWQDFGSAFHTAFSLLGGNESLSVDMPEALAAPVNLEAADTVEVLSSEQIDEMEAPDVTESVEDMKMLLPVAHNNVEGGENEDIVIISSQEEDSDEMTLIQIKKQLASKGKERETRARGVKVGRRRARGKGRGRGRGRGKGRGKGRGRSRAVELLSSIADGEESDVMLDNPAEQLEQLQEEEKTNDTHTAAVERVPAHCIGPTEQSSTDCVIIDTDSDQITDVRSGQYDDASEQKEEMKEEGEEKKKYIKIVREYSSISDTEGYDSNALYCICRQKHNKRFMICCDICQEWFHGDCVGVSETQGRNLEKKGQEYICPTCTTKKQLQSEPHSQPEPELSLTPCLSVEESEGHKDQQSVKETVEEEEEEEKTPVMKPEAEPEAEMETNNSLPLCIGPGCSKQALPDSGYCGTDCILQHAAVTMKALSGPKVPKSRGQKNAGTARPIARVQKATRMSKRLTGKAKEASEEKAMKEDDGGRTDAESSLTCDPSLTEVQAPCIPSSQFYTVSKTDNKDVDAESVAVTILKQSPEDTTTDTAASSQLVSEPGPIQRDSQEKANKAEIRGRSKQQSTELDPSIPQVPAESVPPSAEQSSSNSSPQHHETGALMVTKTTYVIPKKQAGAQSPSSSNVSATASCQKPSSTPTLLSETRNLPVPPAPSAPSSRPSQPNNQIRQSIQRSLTSILVKRLCDCEDLEMSESEVAKLVASIEMEMFDIFRNTDSKYMNKYRTIMFNVKDPRNKGLLYRVVRGEISPFRLVRMSQKDMQATKAPEPSAKETEVKDASTKATTLVPKPESLKVDLPSLPNPVRPDRRPDRRPDSTVASQEQKRSLSASALKTRVNQSNQGRAALDIFTCMLKDTTSEHKAHLFDVKCRICTGQILAEDEDEPAKKKPRVSETRDKHESSWRQSVGDDSPLQAQPDSPDMDSPTSSLMDPTSRLIIDSPVLTIVESPASPTMDSPASPILDSPASPVMECPASPTQDTPNPRKPKRAYTPVVIPAVSTVTITRRDPRTAASRFSAMSVSTSSHSCTILNQSAPYAPGKKISSATSIAPVSSLPSIKTLPKSILMKPSSSADPRLYGTPLRSMISESPADGETAKFLAKQDILWKGFLNMLTVAKFVTKGYLVSGCAENLKADLPDTIQIGGRIMPQTVWDYVTKLKTSITKELCVIRFHPATEEEEVAYVSLFSYFSSRGRFGVVSNNSNSIKDVYLVPLSAKESIPSILQPLDGPGLEKNRPNLLLGLAIVQKAKRPVILCQEIEEKRPSVHMSKDPMWIPKPPVLYGSDKLEIFQPYDPETPANTSASGSPSCPGSPSDSSSSGSGTIPSLLTSIGATPPVSTSAVVAATQSISSSVSDKNPLTAHSDKTPLQTILKTLFGNKQTDSTDSCDGDSATTTTGSDKNIPVLSQVSRSMVDPIVQQYGPKSKVKEIQQEENDFDRPYDPEEEYDPAIGYGTVISHNTEKKQRDVRALSGIVDDDVAYDPEDETIFEAIQSDNILTRPHVQKSDSPSSPTPLSTTHAGAPSAASTSAQASTPVTPVPNLPTGTVVVSAATLTEQQRMLEELNKQIEEQKRQLKEQEEALRQQREAVGMFMAHFSVSDSLMSPPTKSLPLSQLTSQTADKTSNPTEATDKQNVNSQTLKQEDTTSIPNFQNGTDTVQDETLDIGKESDKSSSAGEIEDSDVAYDPEDESLFNEIQEDVFQGSSMKTRESSLSRAEHSMSLKGTSPNSHHSRKRRLSPKRRSHRERDRHRSPSRKSQRRSPSHSRRRRERDRHSRSERDRLRHRTRDQSERRARHRKEHTTRRRSHGHRRSPSSPRKKDSVSISPQKQPSPQVIEKFDNASVLCAAAVSVGESNTSSTTSVTIKNDPDEYLLKCDLVENPPCLSEFVHNVKLEISESPKKDVVTDHNDKNRGTFTQVDKPIKQEILLKDKIETPVPLREIDPPIRDSPESPDPDPQFVKPCDIEKSDSIRTEEKRDAEIHTSVTLPLVKVESNCLFIDGQATFPNILCSTVGSPISDVRNLDFRTLDLPGPGIRDQSMIETDKQAGSGIQGSRAEMGSVTKYLGQEINRPGHRVSPTEIRFAGPDQRGASVPGMSSNIWGPRTPIQEPEKATKCSGMTSPVHNIEMGDSKQDIRGQNTVTVVTNSQLTNIDSTSTVMEVGGAQSFMGPQIEDSAPDVKGRGRGQNNKGGCSHSLGMRSSIRGGDVRASSQGSSFGGSRRALEEHTQKRIFQPHGRSADFCRGRGGPQRGRGVHIRGARPNKNYDTLTHDSSDPEAIFKEAQTDTRVEINVHGLDMSESETKHELKERDIAGSSNMGPGHDADSMINVKETGQHRKDIDMQVKNIHGPGLEWKNEKIEQDYRGPMQSIKNLDWSIPGADNVIPNMGCQRNQNPGLDPNMRNLDWSGLSLGMGDGWREVDRRGSGSVRERPFLQNEWMVHKPHRQEPNTESLGHRRGPGGPEFIAPELEKREPNINVSVQNIRETEGPDIRSQEPERRGPSMENVGHRMRGPGNKYTGLALEGPGTDNREPGGPYLRGPGPEKEGQGHGMRGPPGPELRGHWPDRREPDISPGTDKNGPEGQVVWRPRPESRDPVVDGPGTQDPRGPEFRGQRSERRGPRNPDFSGPETESRGLFIEGPVLDSGSSGGPDFRRPRPERRSLSMECPGTDKRGITDPNVWGQGSENDNLFVEGPGLDSHGSGASGFSGPSPEMRGLSIGGSGPDSRRLEGPDFTRPGLDRRGPSMGGPGNDRRESGAPDFRGSRRERRGSSMDNEVTDKRGPGGSELIGPGRERTGPSFEGRGPNRIRPGDQNCGVLVPNRRGSYIGDLGPERSCPQITGPGSHSRGQGGPCFRGPGPESGHKNIGPGGRGSDIRGPPWLEGPGMDGRGPNRRGPRGSNFRGLGAEREPPDMEETENNCCFPGGPQFGGPEPERRTSEEGPEPDRKMSYFRPVESIRTITIMSHGKGPGGLDFRGLNTVGLGPDREEPGGSGFMEHESETRGPYMEGSRPDWRRSGSSDFRDPDIRQKGQNIDGPICDRRDEWGGSDFRVSESLPGTPDIEGPELEKIGQRLRGPRSIRRKIRGRGKDMRSLNQGDRWKGTDTVDQWSDRRGPNVELVNETESSGDNWKRHANRGSDEQGQDYSRQVPHGDWRGPGSRGPGPIRGPLDDWSGPDWRDSGSGRDYLDMVYPGRSRRSPGNEWKEPDRVVYGPERRDSRPFFRGERDSDNAEHGHDRIRLGTRGLDIGNDFRGNIKEPNIKGPGNYRGSPDMMNSGPNERGFETEGFAKMFSRSDSRHLGPENRNSNIKDPWNDGRFLDCGGLGSERPGVGMESHGSGRQGFEHDFRRDRRGPDLRRPGSGPDRTSDLGHGPGSWDTITEVPQFKPRGPTMISPGIDPRGSEQPMNSDMQAADIRVPGYVIRDPDMRHREPGQRVHTNSNQRRSPTLTDFDNPGSCHFSNPYQVARFQSPNQHSAPFNRPPAPTPNSGGKPFPRFDSPQNQQAIKPQRKRAALLPTPTEGLVRFPNCLNNNPDVYSLKQKQMGHCIGKDWSRGRSVSRERDLVRGQRQERDNSPAGKISTRGGDEKK